MLSFRAKHKHHLNQSLIKSKIKHILNLIGSTLLEKIQNLTKVITAMSRRKQVSHGFYHTCAHYRKNNIEISDNNAAKIKERRRVIHQVCTCFILMWQLTVMLNCLLMCDNIGLIVLK